MQRCVSLNRKCKCYLSYSLQDHYSLQLRHGNEKKGKSEGHNLYIEACLTSPGDINGRIAVHLNAPETDNEGQTLQIIPSPLVFFPLAATIVTGKPSRTAETNVGAAVWLGKTFHRCVTKGEEPSLSHCHSRPPAVPTRTAVSLGRTGKNTVSSTYSQFQLRSYLKQRGNKNRMFCLQATVIYLLNLMLGLIR